MSARGAKKPADAVSTPKSSENLGTVLKKFYEEYVNSTTKRLKIVDAYLAYIMLTGIFQVVYCALVGTFPFNSFLSGFISTVGSFVLADSLCFNGGINDLDTSEIDTRALQDNSTDLCLRLQVNPQNKADFTGISPERAFADFVFAHVVLHLVVINFIG